MLILILFSFNHTVFQTHNRPACIRPANLLSGGSTTLQFGLSLTDIRNANARVITSAAIVQNCRLAYVYCFSTSYFCHFKIYINFIHYFLLHKQIHLDCFLNMPMLILHLLFCRFEPYLLMSSKNLPPFQCYLVVTIFHTPKHPTILFLIQLSQQYLLEIFQFFHLLCQRLNGLKLHQPMELQQLML